MSNDLSRAMRKRLSQEIEALSPARREYLSQIFESPNEDAPMMRQLSYGGEYQFFDNCKQVELNGDFSKSDLIHIAQSMQS